MTRASDELLPGWVTAEGAAARAKTLETAAAAFSFLRRLEELERALREAGEDDHARVVAKALEIHRLHDAQITAIGNRLMADDGLIDPTDTEAH